MAGLDPAIHGPATIDAGVVEGVDHRDMCGWPPACKGFSRVGSGRSLAVMCPACGRGRWPQALMGSVDRGPIKPAGSHLPMTRDRSVSIRRLTDDAITLSHPRKSSVCQILFFCSISGPFLCPDPSSGWRRAQPRSRLAAGHRQRRARSGLEGGEHDVRLARVGGATVIIRRLRKSSCRIITPQPMRASLLASAQAATLRGLLASNFISQGSSLARLLHNTDIAPLTNSGANSRCRAC